MNVFVIKIYRHRKNNDGTVFNSRWFEHKLLLDIFQEKSKSFTITPFPQLANRRLKTCITHSHSSVKFAQESVCEADANY